MAEEVKFSHTGEKVTETSIAWGILKIYPTNKGDDYYVGSTDLLTILRRYKGKHISIIIQEVAEAVTK
jgi:hypothetical protein